MHVICPSTTPPPTWPGSQEYVASLVSVASQIKLVTLWEMSSGLLWVISLGFLSHANQQTTDATPRRSTNVLDHRRSSRRLSSLSEEFYVLSLLDVLLSQGLVSLSVVRFYQSPSHAATICREIVQSPPERRTPVQHPGIQPNVTGLGWTGATFFPPFPLLNSCSQGNKLKVDVLFKTMTRDGIVLNTATYAVLLYHYVKYSWSCACCTQG